MEMMTAAEKGCETGQGFSAAARQCCARLARELGETYASKLVINLTSMESDEVFKWFLASILLGSGHDEKTAVKMYRNLEQADILSPEAVLNAGRQALADTLGRNGNERKRYAVRTAASLPEAVASLSDKYQGDLNRLHFFSRHERDLEKNLKGLSKKISPGTVGLFLRELRNIWDKADPPLSEPALLAARNLGLTRAADSAAALEELKAVWEVVQEKDGKFPDFEVALVRLGKNYCQKKRCYHCPASGDCQHAK